MRALEAGRAFGRALHTGTEIIFADTPGAKADEVEEGGKQSRLRSSLEEAADEYGNSSALLSSLISSPEGDEQE